MQVLPDMPDSVVIGIDLGTTNSCVAVYRWESNETIANDQGNRITPSYVAFTDNGRIIGDGAKSHALSNPSQVVFCAKRLIGRKFDDEHVQKDLKLFPFEVVNVGGKPKIRVFFIIFLCRSINH